jgi:hypothetical protein
MAKKRISKKKETSEYRNEDLAPNRGRSTEKTIPPHEVDDWVGYVPFHYKTEAIHLWDNHFRINIWCAREAEHCLYEKYSIDKSFHVVYNNGKFEDMSNPVRKFDTKYL